MSCSQTTILSTSVFPSTRANNNTCLNTKLPGTSVETAYVGVPFEAEMWYCTLYSYCTSIIWGSVKMFDRRVLTYTTVRQRCFRACPECPHILTKSSESRENSILVPKHLTK